MKVVSTKVVSADSFSKLVNKAVNRRGQFVHYRRERVAA